MFVLGGYGIFRNRTCSVLNRTISFSLAGGPPFSFWEGSPEVFVLDFVRFGIMEAPFQEMLLRWSNTADERNSA